MGGAPFVGGHSGNALSLNGSTQAVDLGSPATLALTGSMTVSAWIYSSSFPADDSAIVSGASIGFQLDTSADTGARRIGFKLSNSSGSMMARYGTSNLATNTWYYVTGVYNATSQTLDVYLNGNLDNGTLAGTVTNTQRNASMDVLIGKRAATTGLEFAGMIDDVRIYGRALTQAEIQADMNAVVSSADTTPPTVSITAPANGSTVIGTSVIVSATAADNIGVAGVQFKLDGANLGTEDTSAPYSIAWNASTLRMGPTLYCCRPRCGRKSANFFNGNNKRKQPRYNAAHSFPHDSCDGRQCFGCGSVSATASDNVGVAGVQFKLDGANLLAEDTTAPYSISWNTTTVANGSHSLTAVARDAAGNLQTSSTVTITVNNADTTPPTVSLTAPASGSTVSGASITVSASASDTVGVAGVQFLLDGVALGAEDTSAPYPISWDITSVTNGTHTLAATARDAAGNQTTSSIVVSPSQTSWRAAL